MLNHRPIHVGDPERSVGTSPNHRRTEPVVGRCEKLRLLLIGCSFSYEAVAIASHHQPRHQIVDRLGSERVAVVLFAKIVVSVDHRAAGGRESIRKRKVIKPSQRATCGINRSCSWNNSNWCSHL